MAVKSAPSSSRHEPHQIEENRALRHIESLRNKLKEPVPKIHAVLSYLRWLDQNERDVGRKKLSDYYHELANKRRTEHLYTWNGPEPIVLPKIRKHPDPEKYRSKDLKSVVFDSTADRMLAKRTSKTAQPKTSRTAGKPTPFYEHALNGFEYWPKELYRPPVPKTRYSFGDRFRPGRAGVIVDRIYNRPKCNTHYWTEYQQHQNPIGSGNCVQGKVLNN